MARRETKTVWVASDGKEFLTEREADHHDMLTDALAWLDADDDIDWRDCDPRKVVDVLLQRFNIIPKGPGVAKAA
jgi:hypothetical protein